MNQDKKTAPGPRPEMPVSVLEIIAENLQRTFEDQSRLLELQEETLAKLGYVGKREELKFEEPMFPCPEGSIVNRFVQLANHSCTLKHRSEFIVQGLLTII